ncbi:hypothetical protein KI427_18490 [Rhodococcus ruber]|uniref:hypothetical protein n=1 Tax=Rhodococcus TaxID=1827 RepID=UPI000AAB7080|nr:MULTISPECIES: hypothetical protein [Rhodococcus]UIR39236.1 hypothetical protein LZP97_12450 [Rhodococcus sp. DMF-1]UQB71572.1 hypothetical protein KI427_18490 [Rhodococcus ruber]WML61389.1 hypothetical protein QNA09_16080 [Rhodococcus sp. AH-ZY2]
MDNRERETAATVAAGRAFVENLEDFFGTIVLPSPRPAVTVSTVSLDMARQLAASTRRIDTPVRKSFVRPMTEGAGPIAPLAQIYSGGRSGVVAVKLYLALLWRCSTAPFSTDKPARAWATLLDLEDPEGKGARRVKDAMRTLESAQLISLTAQPGYPNIVTLRDESGSGASYGLPSTGYSFAMANNANPDQRAAQMYFKVPGKLWTQGYMQALSGPGLAMLLILLAEKGGEGERVWFSTSEFPTRYNISAQTRSNGTKELQKLELLRVERESLSSGARPTAFDTQRRRNVYRLTDRAQSEPAVKEASTRRRRRKKGKKPANP